jgi:hypothetical protein
MKYPGKIASSLALAFIAATAMAGVIDPDCTAEKAAKSAASKAAVGVGGRCSPAEAAKDQAKEKAGIEEKGPIEKRTSNNDTPVEKVKEVVKE